MRHVGRGAALNTRLLRQEARTSAVVAHQAVLNEKLFHNRPIVSAVLCVLALRTRQFDWPRVEQ